MSSDKEPILWWDQQEGSESRVKQQWKGKLRRVSFVNINVCFDQVNIGEPGRVSFVNINVCFDQGGGAPALMFSVTKLYDCDVCLVALPSPRRRLKGRSVESPTIEWVTKWIWGGVERSSAWWSSGATEESGRRANSWGGGFLKTISLNIDNQWDHFSSSSTLVLLSLSPNRWKGKWFQRF